MTPLRPLLAMLAFAALALVASPAMAHGGHAHTPEAPERDAIFMGHAHDAPAFALPSPCPADEGGVCCCHGDRCTNPSQPRMCAPSAPCARVRPALSPEHPRADAHPIVVASAHPVGAVGSRGPPARG